MNWNININQKAIAKLNNTLATKLDVKDAIVLEWLMKFHAEPKSVKIMMDDRLYFWAAYGLILQENPLLEIKNKETLSRRLSNLVDCELLLKYVDKKDHSKTYFSITQKCFDLSHRDQSTEKSIGIDFSVGRVSTEKSNNNIIIDNTTTTREKKLKSNPQLIENAMREHKVEKQSILNKIEEFELHCVAVEKKHCNNTDLYSHFLSWLRKSDFKAEANENEVDYFIKMFNEISGKEFVATDDIKSLFARQRANGFTGPMFQKAIFNLYRKDKWHADKGFRLATPEHLLKNENLNKYLNLE